MNTALLFSPKSENSLSFILFLSVRLSSYPFLFCPPLTSGWRYDGVLDNQDLLKTDHVSSSVHWLAGILMRDGWVRWTLRCRARFTLKCLGIFSGGKPFAITLIGAPVFTRNTDAFHISIIALRLSFSMVPKKPQNLSLCK